MHICHVITRLIIGGAQENTILTCEGLLELGHRVTLITGPTDGPEGSLVDRARHGGYQYIELPDMVRSINPWRDMRARRHLAAEFDRLRPDVIHTHSSKAGILGRHAANDAALGSRQGFRLFGRRPFGTHDPLRPLETGKSERPDWRPIVIHTIHGMSFNRTQSWPIRTIYAALEKRAGRMSHRIVAVAESMIRQSVAAGVCPASKMLTVYSGMEVDDFDPSLHDRESVRREWGIGDDRIVVGSVARLFRKKGYEQLIPIMAKAAARDPRLHFVWVGDGAQRPDYEAELNRLNLRNRTTLVGLVPPTEIPRLLAGFDILAHTSQWEGLPRAVVQALLMQVPVAAFDIDGTPEVVIDAQTGRLVPLNDEDAFVSALVALAADPAMREQMGHAGRRHCLERFDWRLMVERLDALYRSLPQI